ncbi:MULTISPECIES: 2-keto-4-pentenoate hydratase [Thalassospira]|uniref:2-keto-4-pentenoate hydratase n=1 Tax=Thalassospira profundimaris TaxID=502049 RepID=A0A367WQ86_9PROT|nr:fumarylacetoacetate hydrolase family protein [Thalassospira profundimaris]RCK43557.1 2-keto-4-pentenoate hydratase [Thalassospira profundimaris]
MTDIKAASRILADAFVNHTLIEPLPADIAPKSFDEAYEVQNATLALTGAKQAGWKLAVATRAAQEKIGADGPLVGPLLDGRILGEGAKLTTNDLNFPNIEAEIAVVMASTPAPDATSSDILDHIKSMHLAIEIADRRYHEKQDPVQTLADLNSTGYFVLGQEIDGWRDLGFIGGTVTTKSDGNVLATNDDPDAWPEIFGGLEYLVGFLAKRGQSLKAGDVITTGACALPTITPHGKIEAIFDGLGTVTAEISKA